MQHAYSIAFLLSIVGAALSEWIVEPSVAAPCPSAQLGAEQIEVDVVDALGAVLFARLARFPLRQ